MSEEWQAYISDTRTICKYGTKCYQKNADHHEHFKHPPNKIKIKNFHNRNAKRYKPYETKKVNEEKAGKSTDLIESPSQDYETQNTEEETKCLLFDIPLNVTFYDKSTDNELLKKLFLVKMPPDFFKFYECLNKEGNSFEKLLNGVNLQLIGPYELLNGKLPQLANEDLYLIHWRFFYDPPEFQAVIKCVGKSQYHIGYFRDDPNENPAFVGSNDSAQNCNIIPLAENLFGALYLYLQNEKSKSPFTSVACQKMMDKVKKWAEEHEYSIEKYDIKKRLNKCVSKTFHGAGISVPFNKKTELGYRRLTESDANIKKLFAKLESAKTQEEKDKVLSDLQPVITYANIAVDECDFGTGLEMGIALFCSGLKELEQSALSCLTSAYSLLNRSAFGKIIQVHLKYRRRGSNMSILCEV